MSNRKSKQLHVRLDGDNIPGWGRLSYPMRKRVVEGLYTFFTALTMFIILAPLAWMFITAFRTNAQVFALPSPLLPNPISFEHMENILFETGYVRWYVNTLIFAGGVVLLTTITSTLAGYGLTRINIPRKRLFARVILFGYMFPAILLAIPMFIFWRQLGWVNSLGGLILAQTATALPFSIWMMWKFFQTVPISLEESAQMAGASRFQAFYEIALPMAKPGMIAIAVFSYAVAWNSFTIPQVLLTSNENWVLSIGMFSFIVQNRVLWGQLMAASALAVIPSFLFVYFLQKYLLRGFRAGGVG